MKSLIIPRLLATLLVASGTLGVNAWAAAPRQGPAAAQDHSDLHSAAKPLPPGKRWVTDAPLREGMTKIRAALEPQLKAVHEDKLGADQYKAIASQTQEQIGHIVANCKLPPEADAALHGILGQMGEGAESMAGKTRQTARDGAIKLVAALDEYGRTFDHPGWKPLHR